MPEAVTYCDVFAFLWRSLQTMGCFFHCFRVQSDPPSRRPHHLVPNSSSTEETGQTIRLSSLFTDQDKDECVVTKRDNLVEKEDGLLKEANFLKACGTLQETPAEICKAVTFAENLDTSGTQKPHIMLNSSSGTPGKTKQIEMLPEIVERSGSCVPTPVLDSSLHASKDIRSPETSTLNFDKSSYSQEPHTVMKPSPYPTPRQVTADMQTPGTAFPANMTNLAKGNAKIRSEYVYTVSNPAIQNSIQQQDCSIDDEHGISSTPHPAAGTSNKKNIGDASLSAWLKPPTANRNPKVATSLGDRPIIGLVATHWNQQEETTLVPQKWWDGNGIPNSTTKYKEDQKVHWHATPFEERLEKALSEESSISQRKLIEGTPLMFKEEADEGPDTATSQLNSVNCPKSVVSF